MGKRVEEREQYFTVGKNGVPVGFFRQQKDKVNALPLMFKGE